MTLALSKPSDLARRIARGEAHSYWEQNLVDGRRAAIYRVIEWMRPLDGRRVLTAAGSGGHLARKLASLGAEVVDCADDAALHAERAAASGLDLRSGCAADVLASDRGFEDVVLWERLERLDEEGAARLFDALQKAAPERLYVALRLQPKWSRWLAGYPGDELPTADPVRVLRSLHLATDYRLHRHDTITRRNSALRILELRP